MKLLISSVFVLLFSAAVAAAQSYYLTDLGRGMAYGINNHGQVVGQNGTGHAFLYSGGTTSDVGTLGGTYSTAYGINDSGTVVGDSDTATGQSLAFVYDGTMHLIGSNVIEANSISNSGKIVGALIPGYTQFPHAFLYDGTLHDLGSYNSRAYSINASDQIVGIAGNAYNAFLYDGTMHDLGTLTGSYFDTSEALGINNSGIVVGYSDAPFGREHAFLYDGTMHDIDTVGGVYSVAFGINASGEVVGASESLRAFLYTSNNGMIDLNTLIDPLSGWELTTARAINDAGQIVGYGTAPDDPYYYPHAFLLTPVPEPSTLSLAALGVVGLFAARRRYR